MADTVFKTIEARRSIRRFRSDQISKEQIVTILQAGRVAPSGKNKQPWRFIVVASEEARQAMCDAMEKGLNNLAGIAGEGFLGSARPTLRVMRSAPVTIIVTALATAHPIINEAAKLEISDIVDLQSIGAAMQNMILAAWEMGIGSLWICDTFQAYPELVNHFNLEGLLVAAVSFGIADEEPAPRPRKPLDDLARWL